MASFRLFYKSEKAEATLASILNARMRSFIVSYLQSLQESEGPKPATTRNQTESGIVQHFPIIIPRTKGAWSARENPRGKPDS